MARGKFGYPGVYNATPVTLDDGEGSALAVNANGELITNLEVSDIEIGAVEIKNGADDTRLNIATDDSTMPATPTVVPVAGEYRATPTTYADGDATVLQTDVNGNALISQATKIAGEDLTNDVTKVEQRFSYANVATTGTNTIKSGAGFLHTLVINTPLATGSLTLYDNTAGSGTKIATITFPAALLANTATLVYDVAFSTGLTIVGATANIDYTVSYR